MSAHLPAPLKTLAKCLGAVRDYALSPNGGFVVIGDWRFGVERVAATEPAPLLPPRIIEGSGVELPSEPPPAAATRPALRLVRCSEAA